MKQQIRQLILEAIKKLYPDQLDIAFSVEFAPENIEADLASNVALILAKKVGKKPMEVAVQLAEELEGVSVAAPGFLNFLFGKKELLQNLNRINKDPASYGRLDIGGGRLALVEYFQLNVAKPPHVGHLRSAVIGDSLKRILKFVGYHAISDTHIGDWGTQFGLLLLAYKTLDGKKRLSDRPLEELNELYQEINRLVEVKPELHEQAKQEFVKLEQGDLENRKLWEFFVKVSKEKFAEMVKLLKLERFEYDLGESFYEERMKEIVKQLDKRELLKTGSTGEKYVDLEKFGLGRLICVKSDSGTTYELRDLATLAYRYDELTKKEKAELALNLYVVDVRQAHDFQQVFKTMELLGYDTAKSRHIEFGFMSLPEGAFSTRKGTTVALEKLLTEAKSRALAIIKEKNPDLKNKEQVAEQVGLAAIKYADLGHNRRSDIIFDWDKALSFEGNTGPYLQYTHARFCSILHKAEVKEKLADIEYNEDFGLERYKLLRKLYYFPDIIADAAKDFMPSMLANYLFELAEAANSFYHEFPVIKEKNEATRRFRLALVKATTVVLKNGLNLLGIEAPEEM